MNLIVAIVLCVLCVFVVRLLLKPISWVIKLLLHAAIGFTALFLLNFFGSAIGLFLEMSWINALITGILGLPGVLVLLALRYL